MQRQLRIPNPTLQNSEKTYFDADYTSGTSLVVISSFTFATNNIVVAGNIGDKTTEASVVNNLTVPLGITIAPAFNFDHIKGTVLYKSVWDKMSIEGKQGSGAWQSLTNMPIQWDKMASLYIHSSGDDSWSYRFRLYNSVLNIYSDYSHTQTGAGFSRNQVGQMILNVRRKIRDPNARRFSDTDIMALMQDANATINAEIPKLWYLKVDTWETAIVDPTGNIINPGVGLPTVTNQTRYALNTWSDIDTVASIKYYYTKTGSNLLYELQFMPPNDFDPYLYNQNRPKSDTLFSYKLLPPDNASIVGYFEVNPIPLLSGVGMFYPVYWKKPTVLSDIMTTTECPFPEILEDYCAWKLHTYMGNDSDATTYKHLFYGPASTGPSQHITGIKMLQEYNNRLARANSRGRNLWNWRGRKDRMGFGGMMVNHDFLKEAYM